MVLALPRPKAIQYTSQATFANIHGSRIDTAQALEAAARVYMDEEYTTGGNRTEAIVTSLLTTRWQRVHEDMIGDIAWIAIYSDDHKGFGECRPDMRGLTTEQRNARAAETYRQLVLHLEVPGLAVLLNAQKRDDRSARLESLSSRSSRSTSESRTTSEACAA